MGRFLMPLLPFYVLAVAWYLRNLKLNKVVISLCFLFFAIAMIGMKYKVHQEGKIHNDISESIYSKYGDDHVFYDLSRRTNVVRYLNPMHGSFDNQADMTLMTDEEYTRKVLQKYGEGYIIQTLNTANQAKSDLTSSISNIVNSAKNKYNTTEVERIKIKPGLQLQVLKIEKKDGE